MIILVKKLVWLVATTMIILSSIYLSIKFHFPQLKIKTMVKKLFKNHTHKSLDSFQLLMMNLAGKIGVGSIAGVAISIYVGGIGSIIWMWIISIFSAILTYCETILGMKYHIKKKKNVYGGPSYYIKNGLKKPFLGSIYAIIIILSYIGGFISIQTNTINKSIQEYVTINPVIVGVIISFLAFLVISKGVSKIASVSEKMVPFMIFLYLLTGILIIIKNINQLPTVFLEMLEQAFCFKSFISGFIPSFVIGIQRGIFATEAGLGTGSMAASISNNKARDEADIQMLGVYITSFLICTITAFSITLSNYQAFYVTDLNGIEMIRYIFYQNFGNIGNVIIFISVLLFAFSTILTGYYYGETSFQYFGNKCEKLKLWFLNGFTIVNIILGCILPSELIWNLVDIFVAILSIINIYAILKLKDDIIREK